MRKLCVTLLALLLLMPQVAAAEESTPLRFGTDGAVNAIDASYTLEAGVQDVQVTFSEAVAGYAQYNVVNGKLLIAIASSTPIDLSQPLGQVTAKNAAGQVIAPALTLASLQFNGQDAERNLTVSSATAQRSGSAVQVAIQAAEDFGGSGLLCAAAYDAAGRQLTCAVQTLSFAEGTGSFSLTLGDCADAARVKVFLLSEQWRPITTETIQLGQ